MPAVNLCRLRDLAGLFFSQYVSQTRNGFLTCGTMTQIMQQYDSREALFRTIYWEILMTEEKRYKLWKTGPLVRVELFSDAVFAIAITLLIVDIKVPEANSSAELADSLSRLWPHFLAYFLSFMIIAMQWVDHHEMFEHIEKCDRGLLWLNLVFLMGIAFLPFPTALVGCFPNERVAVLIYSASIVFAILVKTCLWKYVANWRPLVKSELSPELIRSITTTNTARLSVSVVLLVFACFWPWFALRLWAFFGIASLLFRFRTNRMT
jgi:uncharacterized membrane protein